MNPTLRIAVADDEPRMREFYKEVLPLLGHEVVCAASSGRELIAGYQASRPNLIITDIRMPDLNGIEAVREIWRQEPVPIILVSAHDDAELLNQAGEYHVLAYLVKPIKNRIYNRPFSLPPDGSRSFNLYARKLPTCARHCRTAS